MYKSLSLFLLVIVMSGTSSCVHKTNGAYTTDTAKVDTIEHDNDFPVDTAPVKIDTLSTDSANKVDSSALITPIKSEDKK